MLLPPPQGLLSTIVSVDGMRYRIRRDDLVWLARMVKFEGGENDAAALLWTLAQRFAWIDRGRFSTLTELAQSFSQPINPIWRRDGEKCRPRGPFHNAPDCAPAALARRDRATKASWRNLDPQITAIVAAWATGRVPNPVPTSTNWAASRPLPGRSVSVAQSYLDRTPGASLVVNYGGNTFIAEGDTRKWAEDHVSLVNRDGSVTTTELIAAPALLSLSRGFGFGSRLA